MVCHALRLLWGPLFFSLLCHHVCQYLGLPHQIASLNIASLNIASGMINIDSLIPL